MSLWVLAEEGGGMWPFSSRAAVHHLTGKVLERMEMVLKMCAWGYQLLESISIKGYSMLILM